MKREEIIRSIEKMRDHGVTEEWRTEFTEVMRDRLTRRSALADDFHRAIIYCFIVWTRIGYLNKERRNFLRPTKRAILMAIGLMVAAILQIILLVAFLALLKVDKVYAVLIVTALLLFELGYVVSKGNEMFGTHAANELGMSTACIACGYDLSGHDSVLGPQLSVGPEQCPECGKAYPAIK